MKNTEKKLEELIAVNVAKILKTNDWRAVQLAIELNTTESLISKKLSGKVKFSLGDVEDLASALSNMARRNGKSGYGVIDLITYPDRYVKIEQGEKQDEPIETVLQIKLQKSKKEQVLRLIFGDNDIELLNH